MTARLTLLLALILWPGLVSAQPRPGAQQRPVILVLDASGSMWKRVTERGPRRGEIAAAFSDGFTKAVRDQARRAGPASTAEIGLVRFGYRFSARDPSRTVVEKCSDIEHIPPARADKSQVEGVAHAAGAGQVMDDQGQGWNPKGMTPVTQAILQAASDAPAGGADLVVVTDIVEGEAICMPDPCPGGVLDSVFTDPTGDFVKKGIRVKFLIAAGLEEADSRRAKQLSECFQASFLNPQNLLAAHAAGTQVGQTLVPVQPSLDIDLRLVPSAGRPLTLPDGFGIADLGLTLVPMLFHNDRGAPIVLGAQRVTVRLPVGQHDGHVTDARGDRVGKVVEMIVPAPQGAALAIDLPPATLIARAEDAGGQPMQAPLDWSVTFVPPSSAGAAATSRPVQLAATGARLELDLPPGRYVVVCTHDGQSQRKDIDLRFGQTNEQTRFIFKTEPRMGTLVLQVRDAAGALDARSPSPVVFRLVPRSAAGPDIPGAGGTQQRVPVGTYLITPRLVGSGGAASVDLPTIEAEAMAGQSTVIVANLPAAVLDVEPNRDGVPFVSESTRFEVWKVRPDGTAVPDTVFRGPRLIQRKVPGRYRVRVVTTLGTKDVDADLADGDRTSRKIRFP